MQDRKRVSRLLTSLMCPCFINVNTARFISEYVSLQNLDTNICHTFKTKTYWRYLWLKTHLIFGYSKSIAYFCTIYTICNVHLMCFGQQLNIGYIRIPRKSMISFGQNLAETLYLCQRNKSRIMSYTNVYICTSINFPFTLAKYWCLLKTLRIDRSHQTHTICIHNFYLMGLLHCNVLDKVFRRMKNDIHWLKINSTWGEMIC
jgi:hypothetical protein